MSVAYPYDHSYEPAAATVHAAEIDIDGVAELVEVLALGTETLLGRNMLSDVTTPAGGGHALDEQR